MHQCLAYMEVICGWNIEPEEEHEDGAGVIGCGTRGEDALFKQAGDGFGH